MRLGHKFTLLVATILALTLGLNALYFVQRQRHFALEQLAEIGRSQGELLALIAPDAILGFDFVRLNGFVEQITRQPDIVFATVLGAEGEPLTSPTAGDHPALLHAMGGQIPADAAEVTRQLARIDGLALQRFPILHAEQRLGELIIAVDQARVERMLRDDALRQLLIYAGIIAILGGAIIGVFRLNVLRPVAALIKGAKRVSEGDYRQPVRAYYDDEMGTLTQSFNAMMTEIRRERELLDYQANYDNLTGLPNRNMATEHILRAIALAQSEGTGFAVMFIDLDNFKYINDTLGHGVGDRLLVEVSREFRKRVRAVDVLARLGGDEYLVLLPGCDSPVMAQTIAGRVTGVVENPIRVGELDLHVRCSVGIAFYPQDGDCVDSLMAAADGAMYAAKRDPATAISFYTRALNEAAKRRVEFEHHIHQAMQREEFYLAFQPIVRAADGRCVGAEVLLRWEHPELGIVPPGQFIPIAESTGQIVALGDWVLDQACATLHRLDHERLRLPSLSVNVSRNQMRGKFADRVLEIIKRHSLAPGRLVLELTESILMEEHSDAEQILTQWRDAGVKLSLDDFGTGFSSLSYLKRFDFDVLKIDKSFVDGLPESADSASLIDAIIAIARSLGMETVAEGVEREAQRDLLAHQGCRHLQGYLFARPMPLAEFRDYLRGQQDASAAQAESR